MALRKASALKIAAGVAVAAAIAVAVLPASRRCETVGARELSNLSLAHLGRGQAQSYCYNDDAGRRIRFVLARGSDGRVRSVLDACRECFSYHKGFKLEAGALVCRYCGNRYSIDEMTRGKASCVPVALPIESTGDGVRIKLADLVANRGLFR